MALINSLKLGEKLFEIRILRITDVAMMLTLSKAHIYRLVSEDKIPFHKKGKNLFFIEKEIIDWLTNGDN